MVLLGLSLISAIYGIILISSVVTNFPPGSTHVNVQISAMVIGVLLFVLFSYVDIDIIADKSKLLFILSLGFLSLLLIWGVGEVDVGERGWLRFGDIGIQPAEIVKITFIIIIAKMISNYKELRVLNSFFSIAKLGLVFVIMFGAVVFISQDLGSAIVYFAIFLIMLFIGGVKLRWFALAGVVLVALSPLLWTMLTPLQQARIMAPYFPLVVDPTGEDTLWQVHQSLRAISSGGFTGVGLGYGRFTQGRLIPAQHTDFIFSAAGEELGFVGCIVIVGLLIAITVRCFRVGIKSNNALGLLVCSGIAGMLIFHTISNIGMVMGFLPVIGIPLPFFSYGGSSIVTCFAAMGIVSGIKMRPKPERFKNY